MMALGREQYYCISLCEKIHAIQLSFLLHEKNRSSDQRIELFQYIQFHIELLMKDFMQASTKPKAYVPCYFENCNKLHVELQLLLNGICQNCPTEEKPLPYDYYFDIFPKQGV